jgi:molybdopterin converting factor small subunit
VIKVSIKGEREFGLPRDYTEVELSEPTIEAALEHFNVNQKIRKYLLLVVNNQISKPDAELQDGDEIIIHFPYSGG